MRYKYIIILIALILLFFKKCYHFDPDTDDFDETIIPILSEFRDVYYKHKNTIFTEFKYASDLKILSLCEIPQSLKSKMSQELILKLCKLQKSGKIQRVALHDGCINFNIKVYNNSIVRTKWLELALVHDGNVYDENFCSSDLYRGAVQIKKFEGGWTLILYKAYASWRG